MRRTFKVRLSRQVRVGKGKKARTVTRTITPTVYQVTLRGFTEATRAAAHYSVRFIQEVKKGEKLTDRELRMALAHPDCAAAIADVLCPSMPRGWWAQWHSVQNLTRMIDAARKTSDWWRLVCELKVIDPKDGGKPADQARAAGLYEDAVMLARMLGVNPQEVIDGWPMEHFLDVAESLIQAKKAADEAELAADPTMDPHAKPTPLIPGYGKQFSA
jgi:hypothetical protein